MWRPPATKFCWKTSTCHQNESQRIANVLPQERKRVGKVEDVNEQGAKDKSESRRIAKGHGKGRGGAGEGQQGLSHDAQRQHRWRRERRVVLELRAISKKGACFGLLYGMSRTLFLSLESESQALFVRGHLFLNLHHSKNMNWNLRVVRCMIELLELCRTTRRLVTSSHREFFEEESLPNISTSSDKNLQEKKQIIAKSKYIL